MVDRDINGPPFGWVQDGIAGQIGGGPPQHGQVLNPPGDDDQGHGQGRFQAIQGAESQGFHPAAGFKDSEENLNTPAASVPLDQFGRWRERNRRAVSQQPPVERFDPGRRGFFPRPDHEFVDIAFPVGDVNQPGVGPGCRPLGAAREAFPPAHALLGFNRPMPLVVTEGGPVAGPAPSAWGPAHAAAESSTAPTRRCPAGGVVQLGAVLDAQHPTGWLRIRSTLPSVPVGREHLLPRHRLMGQQPIRRLRLRPAPAGHRNTGARLRTQTFRHPHQPSVQPRVPQVRSTPLRCRPTHRRRHSIRLMGLDLFLQMRTATPAIKRCGIDSLKPISLS